MITKGQKIRVTGNSIFKCMGHDTVTGVVFLVREDNSGCSIKCDQTNAMETVDFDDGTIEVGSSQEKREA